MLLNLASLIGISSSQIPLTRSPIDHMTRVFPVSLFGVIDYLGSDNTTVLNYGTIPEMTFAQLYHDRVGRLLIDPVADLDERKCTLF